jgi:hypoxanthine phosphoribosyltransferase
MADQDIERILLTSIEIESKTEQLALELSSTFRQWCSTEESPELVLVGVLKGSYMFMSDLSRKLAVLHIPHKIDFMTVSSYVDTNTTGNVKILSDLRHSIQDRHVVIVEDILDSGLTLKYLINVLRVRQPKSLQVCVLLRKPTQVKVDIDADTIVGFDLDPPEFVVGYGLDYNEHFRGLPYIGVPNKDAIEKYKSDSC